MEGCFKITIDMIKRGEIIISLVVSTSVALTIMFSLVSFTEDRVKLVCKSSSVTKARGKLQAPYGHKKYECIVIAVDDNKHILEQLITAAPVVQNDDCGEQVRKREDRIGQKLTVMKHTKNKNAINAGKNLTHSRVEEDNEIEPVVTVTETAQEFFKSIDSNDSAAQKAFQIENHSDIRTTVTKSPMQKNGINSVGDLPPLAINFERESFSESSLMRKFALKNLKICLQKINIDNVLSQQKQHQETVIIADSNKPVHDILAQQDPPTFNAGTKSPLEIQQKTPETVECDKPVQEILSQQDPPTFNAGTKSSLEIQQKTPETNVGSDKPVQVEEEVIGEVEDTDVISDGVFEIVWTEKDGQNIGNLLPVPIEKDITLEGIPVHWDDGIDVRDAVFLHETETLVTASSGGSRQEEHQNIDYTFLDEADEDDDAIRDPSYRLPEINDDWLSDEEGLAVAECSLMSSSKVHHSTFQEMQPNISKLDGEDVNMQTVPNQNHRFNVSRHEQPIGDSFKNPTAVTVNSSTGAKSYGCKFCGKMLKGKIIRHLETVHANEEEVKKLSLVPKIKRCKGKPLAESERTRARIMQELNNKGNFVHNVQAGKDEQIIPSRRGKRERNLSEYRICAGCKGLYSKQSIRKHYKICMLLNFNGTKQVQTLHNLALGDIHDTANPLLRRALAGLKKMDDACLLLKYDPLIVAYGNILACKFQTSDHHARQIRASMRLLGRLLLTLRHLDPEITDLGSLYRPGKFEVLVKAANILGLFDDATLVMRSPATARDIGRLVKEVKKIWVLECTEKRQDQLIKDAKDFMRSFKVKFSILVGTTIAESQTQMNIAKGAVVLPSLSDIRKLNLYLIQNRTRAYQQLQQGFDLDRWKELAELTLVSILLLNRRRPGELQRMKIVNYQAIQRVNANTNVDIYNQLSTQDKNTASRYSRVILRGKKNAKNSPVLLDFEMEQCIELLLHHRQDAEVSPQNQWVFGTPSAVDGICKKTFEIVPLLTKFSRLCGADIPTSLKSVELRKHIATVGLQMQLSASDVDALSGFMGHDRAIHEGIYRQRLPVNDIVKMSKLLELAQGQFIETENGHQTFVDETDDSSDEERDNGEQTKRTTNSVNEAEWHASLNESLRETAPPVTPGTKISWTDDEMEVILHNFGARAEEKMTIPGSEIQAVLNTHKCFRNKNRNVMKVRSMLQSHFRTTTPAGLRKRKRITTPGPAKLSASMKR